MFYEIKNESFKRKQGKQLTIFCVLVVFFIACTVLVLALIVTQMEITQDWF
jgi:hypothetical protein